MNCYLRGLFKNFLIFYFREVQQAIQGINTLYEKWKDLLNSSNTSQNEEFKWTATELKTGLRTIELDLNDLEDTISILIIFLLYFP